MGCAVPVPVAAALDANADPEKSTAPELASIKLAAASSMASLAAGIPLLGTDAAPIAVASSSPGAISASEEEPSPFEVFTPTADVADAPAVTPEPMKVVFACAVPAAIKSSARR